MDLLPVEIVEKILIDSRISIEDVLYLSFTCRHLYNIITNSNRLWKTKLFQKWPSLEKNLSLKQYDYREEIIYLYDFKKMTMDMLELMSPKFYKKSELSDHDLQVWSNLLEEREEVYHYLVMDLMEIVNTNVAIKSIEVVPLNTPGNRTLQYYANKVLRFVRQWHLSKFWKSYISLPPSKQILEVGATFVAQWCQPDIEVSFDSISRELDQLAEMVKIELRFTNSKHPFFLASQEQLHLWRNENLPQNQYNAEDCRELLLVIREVLFKKLGFEGNVQHYYSPENSYINKVLQMCQGLPITLAIIFEAVARRMGLRCDPISFPAHFLLRFCENKDDDSEWYYIDVFNGGELVRKGACLHSRLAASSERYPVATATQVVERMANNLEVSARQNSHHNGKVTRIRSSLELLKLVNPRDLSALVNLARLYMLHSMDTKPLESFLLSQEFDVPEQAQRVVHMLRDYEDHHLRSDILLFQVEPAPRSPNLLYAVGMVMKHLTLNYRCVIYDWDLVCLAAVEWREQNNVDKLHLKNNQPFYNVLVEDGSHRYVAQENLRPTSENGTIYLNDDLGRHFSHYFETHYVPNAEKEKEYPADKKVRHMFYQRKKLESFAL